MTLGSVIADGNQKVLTVGKDGTNPISVGALCIRDTAASPKGYKQCPATTLQVGPFVVCVNKAAVAADRTFAAAFPGTTVVMKAQGAIQVGAEVQNSATVSGAVMAFAGSAVATPTAAEVLAVQADRLRVVGRYLGHENEMTGGAPATDAADTDLVVIRLGGGAA
jgi:hypothetical protein